jgi:mannan endo-1,6-alpha-mannosidase
MTQYYTGYRPGDIPGNLPQPYYWWEAGAMFGALVDYWYFTGDDTYNEITTQALLAQVGPNNDYMPPNQTKTEGNDDQAFWGMAALSAAEDRYPNPPASEPQWLALAQAVFNSQAIRWDNTSCNGGLKWQIFTFNNGYNYKNTISNGCFFNMAARLAVYTGNTTYADWANRMYDWTSAIGLMSPTYQFFDGTDDTLNCSQLNHIQWSYNTGVFMLGAANMYNFVSAFQDRFPLILTNIQTGGKGPWEERLRGIITGAGVFFQNNIMYEVACESNGKCNIDQRSFKAYLARWMAATMVRAPFTRDLLLPLLQTSAKAAAQSCTGGSDGQQCGLQWTTGSFDGSVGVGEQMSAMEVIQSNLWDQVPGPVTAESGGISEGDPSAGTAGDQSPIGLDPDDISTGDRVGAGFLTTMVLIGVIGGAWWMVA